MDQRPGELHRGEQERFRGIGQGRQAAAVEEYEVVFLDAAQVDVCNINVPAGNVPDIEGAPGKPEIVLGVCLAHQVEVGTDMPEQFLLGYGKIRRGQGLHCLERTLVEGIRQIEPLHGNSFGLAEHVPRLFT